MAKSKKAVAVEPKEEYTGKDIKELPFPVNVLLKKSQPM